jgi:trimeric autotransporter adhesin
VINTTPLNRSYLHADELPYLLRVLEGFVAVPYDDLARVRPGSQGHIPTIGIGINLLVDSNLALVLDELGVFAQSDAHALANETTIARQARYISLLNEFSETIRSHYPLSRSTEGVGASQSEVDLKSALDFLLLSHGVQGGFSLSEEQAIAIKRHAIEGFIIGPFAFSSSETFNNQGKQAELDAILQPLGFSSSTRDSREYEALMSLYYNNPNLIGRVLREAIVQGNRAEAWYQIRYQSNADQLPGQARRRAWEATLFGLFESQPPSIAEARAAYQTLERHRTQITSYEATYGSAIASAEATYFPQTNPLNTQILSLRESLHPALSIIVADLNASYGVSLNASAYDELRLFVDPVLTAPQPGQASQVWQGTLDARLHDAQGNELASNDILVGLGRNDTLVAGSGDDILAGGSGNDVLDGGTGNDRYLFATGDGIDSIVGNENDGLIVFDGVELTGTAVHSGTENVWRLDKDGHSFYLRMMPRGELRIATSIAALTATSGVDRIAVSAFQSGDLGIQLQPRVTSQSTVLDESSALAFAIDIGANFTPGSYLRLAANNLAGNLAVVTGADTLSFVNGVLEIPLNESQLSVQLALLTIGDVDVGDQPVTLGAQIVSAGGQAVDAGALNFTYSSRDEQFVDDTSHEHQIRGSGSGAWIITPYDWFTEVPMPPYYVGTPDNQLILGSGIQDTELAAGDYIDGGAGDDFIIAGSGRDTLFGGDGNDFIRGSQAAGYSLGVNQDISLLYPHIIDGTAWGVLDLGNGAYLPLNWTYAAIPPEVIATDAPNYIDGGAGNDDIDAGGNADFARGGTGDDKIRGAGNDDTLLGDDGADIIYGDGFDNGQTAIEVTLLSQHGADFIDGGSGNDFLYGQGGADTVYGGLGSDQLVGDDPDTGAGDDYLDGEDGDDSIFGGAGNDTVFGGADNDQLVGDGAGGDASLDGEDFLDGGAGADTLFGSGGNDVLLGGDGDDSLSGDGAPTPGTTSDDDVLDGGAGNDTLFGGRGSDLLIGGVGNDSMDGDGPDVPAALTGDDTLDGGEGDDVIRGSGGNDTLQGGAGIDFLFGGSDDDVLDGGEDDDQLAGDDGEDTLQGGAGADLLFGDDGDDTLDGGAGSDQLEGGAGNDLLISDGNNEVLMGGAGDDTYVIDGTSGDFTISDNEGTNQIIINGLDAETTSAQLADFGVLLQSDGQDFLWMDPATFRSFGSLTFDSGDSWDADAIQHSFSPGAVSSRNISLGQGVSFSEIQYFAKGDDLILLYGGQVFDWVETGTLFDQQVMWSETTSESLGLSPGGQALVLTNWYRATPGTYADHLQDVNLQTQDFNSLAANATGIVFGSAEDDVLSGGALSDDIRGYAGNDFLSGGAGDNLLDGGLGEDFLIGGDGNDTFIYRHGDGTDLIVDSSVSTVDTLRFDAGIASSDLTITEAQGGLNVQVGAPQSGDSIFIANTSYEGGQAQPIERFEFVNGTIWNASEIDAHVSGNRVPKVQNAVEDARARVGISFEFTLPANTFVDPNAGDQLTYSASLANGDALPAWLSFDSQSRTFSGTPDLADIAALTIIVTATDPEGAIAVAPFTLTVPQTIVLTGTEESDTLAANTNDNFIINGLAGSDTLSGGAGDDTLSGGAGWDTLQGGIGSDTYLINRGDGFDWIPGTLDPLSDSIDTVQFGADIAPEDIRIGHGGNTLYVSLLNPATRRFDLILEVEEALGANGEQILDMFVFADSTTWSLAEMRAMTLIGSRDPEVLSGFAADDILQGNGGDDLLYGDGGNDTLFGGTGNDQLVGVAGDDTYRFGRNQGMDEISDSAGVNRIVLDADVAPGDVTLHRTSGGGFLWTGQFSTTSDDLVVMIDGGAQQIRVENYYSAQSPPVISQIVFADGTTWDTAAISARVVDATGTQDSFTGTSAADNYVVNHRNDFISESANGGVDSATSSVNYTLPTEVENLTLSNTSLALVGMGNSSQNVITGNAYDNVLDGGAGVDTLIGGAGNDTYRVDTRNPAFFWDESPQLRNFTDVVTEGSNGGYDTIVAEDVYSAVLPDHVEALVIDGIKSFTIVHSASDDIRRRFVGNSMDNLIDASLAADVGIGTELIIDGGAGSDLMIGPRDDFMVRYIVDNVGDQIVVRNFDESVVETTVSFTMSDGLKAAELKGSAAITLTGNDLANRIDATQNSAANQLYGGRGDDRYVLGAGDVANELAGEGSDTLVLTVAASSYSISSYANIENLELASTTGGANLFGSSAANVLRGNSSHNVIDSGSGNDVLDSGGGADTLIGGQGDDSYYVHAGDVVQENASEGIDTVFTDVSLTMASNVENATIVGTDAVNLTGNSLDNIMTGSTGVNVLSGGAGNDTYYVLNNPTTVVEDADSGFDVVRSRYSFALGANIENLILEEVGFNGTGNALDNAITGNHANNILDGGAGADVLTGGDGDDTYVIDNSNDVIVELADEGIDTVMSSLAMTLASPLENLTLLGSANVNGTGNGSDNILIGNEGTNVLTGGQGNDTYVIQNSSDSVVENASEGFDIVLASASFVLSSNVEDIVLTGSGAINATGNALNNSLTGNTGANQLAGGAGDDTYYVQNSSDVVVENAAEGTDLVIASASFVLSENIENLTLNSGDWQISINGTGNDLANTLLGDNGANVLIGLGGNDIIDGGGNADDLRGGAGDDTYYVNQNLDVIVEAAGEGADVVYASGSYVLSGHVETLVLTGSAVSGTGNAQDNYISGTASDNTLNGGAGNDTLDGGAGSDSMTGGQGDDNFFVDSSTDTTVELSNEGTDTVRSALAWTLSNEVENLVLLGTANINGFGNALNNVLDGNSGNNTLNGGTGADTLRGGAGNDTYTVDNVGDTAIENADSGTDKVNASVSFALSANVENLTLTGSAANNATGNDLANTINGNSGDNTIDGGAGVDAMTGGLGNDTYIVDHVGDVVSESTSSGTDTVQSSVSYVLSSNVERLTLLGGANLNATGNGSANILTGNSGNNTLDGAGNADSMIGGGGNDVYIVESTGDTITELAGEGIDEVRSSVTYTIAAEIDNLVLTGTSAISGNGNALANNLTGTTGANTLDGKAGADTMSGLSGNDVYVVDDAGDVVVESAGAGTDLVQASVSYTLSANVENLTLTGTAAINATGNELVNSLTGNSGDNILHGGAGSDSMSGGTGNDTYIVDSTLDVVTEGTSAGTDLVQSSATFTLGSNVENLTLTGIANVDAIGNTLANVLIGNSGNNLLNGGTGSDTLTGGAGDDTYVMDVASDVIVEDPNEGTDSVQAGFTYTLLADFENLALTGTGAFNATGNSTDNVLTGNSGVNRIDGGSGADTMSGGAGNDTYVVENAGDVVVEIAAAGTDIVEAWVDYTLSANIETLTLFGSALNGTGNASNNTINGTSGDNILDGGGGVDVMVGGAGNDTYVVDVIGETTTEGTGAGTDIVLSSASSFTLGSNVENLTLIGTGNIDGTGNTQDNVLIGNSGNNVLTGGTGTDTMTGGAGNDTYDMDVASDVIVEDPNEGVDTVKAAFTHTLGANFENLTLTSTGAFNGTGNASDNVLTGNSGANTLLGLDGNDTLDGGTGNDRMEGGTGDDVYVVNATGDVVVENASAGQDLVRSSITYTLGAELENLELIGTSAVNGTGNAVNNTITGNSNSNTLNGGTGTDTLSGGAGDDTYVIDDVTDVVVESAGAGTDTVQTGMTYTLLTDFENLTLTGTGAFNGTGNALNNALLGNSGANSLIGDDGNDTLDGAGGADTLQGGAGDDTYTIDATDTVTELAGEGIDLVKVGFTYTLASTIENLTLTGTGAFNGTGNASDNVLIGNSGANTLLGLDGNDTLDGGTGNDRMEGGTGNDVYVVNAAGDVVVENASSGQDLVKSAVVYTLGADVENLELTGSSAVAGTGNALNNVITGNTGANTLTGGDGDDTLHGGTGTAADTLVGGLGADTYIYAASQGLDVIDNVAADSAIDRLLFTSLSSDLFTFSRTGDSLLISRNGTTTSKVTVNNWFTATANRVDLVTFSNREVTADEIDTLVNGGGGSFPLALLMETQATDGGTSRHGMSPRRRYFQELRDGTLEDSAGAATVLDELIGTDSASATTLADKLDGKAVGARVWRPIKSFLDERTSVGFDRLVDAMATFGAEAVTDVGSPEGDGISRGALEQLAAGHELHRANHAFRNEWRALAE